jgi:hypothetical protein
MSFVLKDVVERFSVPVAKERIAPLYDSFFGQRRSKDNKNFLSLLRRHCSKKESYYYYSSF